MERRKKLLLLAKRLNSGSKWVKEKISTILPYVLTNAAEKPILELARFGKVELRSKVYYDSLTQYGKCVQNGTPAPAVPADILCNNGAIKARHQSGLPLGYTLLAYVRSSGTQYIDLGYKGNGNTKVEVKYKYYDASTATGSGRVFGSRIAAQEDAFAFGTSAGIVAATETNKVFWCYDSQPYFVNNENFGLNVWKNIVFSAKEHTIDGASVGDDYNIVEFETPQNLKLFGFDQGGTVGVGYVDVKYCKLWDNGVLVRDLVPAKNASNVVGMYDFVSGQFLTNAGTGDFVAGDPVDDPVEIYAGGTHPGKNLANVNADTALVGYYISAQGVVSADPNNWMYQNFIPVEPNTSYTLSMSQAVYYVTISEYSTAADSGFIVRNVGLSGGNTSLTITTGANTNFIRFGANVNRAEVTLEGVLAINWQLEEGAEATAYEPYTEIPYQPEVLTVGGTNLFDPNAAVDGYYYNPSGAYAMATDARLTDYIPVKTGITYTIATTGVQGGANVRYNLFDSAQNWLSQTVDSVSAGATVTRSITPAQDGYLRISANYTGNSYTDWSVFQVVEGAYTSETMPPYKPYVIPQTITDIPMLLSVGDIEDEGELIAGVKKSKVGIHVFDGTENMVALSTPGAFRFRLAPRGVVGTNPICTHYPAAPIAQNVANAPDQTIKGHASADNSFYIKDSRFETADELKAWLASEFAAGTPVIMLYALEEETTEQTMPYSLKLDANSTITIDAPISDIETLIEAHEHTTPSKDYPLPMWCNNGELTAENDQIAVSGISETITITEGYIYSETATVESLLAVGDYEDAHDVISGAVLRNVGVCVYDGTQEIGDVYLSNTGGKDVGAIIIYPLAETVTDQVTPQALNTFGNPTNISSTSNVLPVECEIEYYAPKT